VDRTLAATRFISLTFLRLAQGRLSLAEISGPIAIYEIAGQEGRKGTEYFIWVMAMISINLGLLNLLPIPVLDGGHILFFVVEGILRRPLPMRVREVAHIMGMAALLFLMAVAFKNDIQQRSGRAPDAQVVESTP
jgi:regulator of sigma E protease